MKFTPEEIANYRELINNVKETEARAKECASSEIYYGVTREAALARLELNRIAGAVLLDALNEIERLRVIERKAVEQSEYIQHEGLTEFEGAGLRAEIARLRWALEAATDTIAAVVGCCTYGSEEQAKVGAYWISPEAFTKIDTFIRTYALDDEALKGGE